MIYLDSWVWLEFALDGDDAEAAAEILETAKSRGAAFSAIGVTEVEYILTRELDRDAADHLSSAMEDMSHVHLVPVSVEVGRRAAVIRSKYYDAGTLELSYADAIHAATAILLECTEMHTGDSDFESITEIDAVIHGD